MNYRALRRRDIIRDGDQYFDPDVSRWRRVSVDTGLNPEEACRQCHCSIRHKFRRPLKTKVVKKSASNTQKPKAARSTGGKK